MRPDDRGEMDIDNIVKAVTVALLLAHIAVLIAVLRFHARQWAGSSD